MGCGSGKQAPKHVPAHRATAVELAEQVAEKPAAASVSGKRHAAARRKRLALAEILKRYDATKTGMLNKDEVKNFATAALERDVTDEEVDLIMRIGGDTCDPQITSAELPDAMAVLTGMIDDDANDIASSLTAKDIDEKFEKYDVNKSGELEKDQLASLLKDLNDGADVPEPELTMVLKQADVSESGAIKREELKPAIMIWYSLQEDEGEAKEGS